MKRMIKSQYTQVYVLKIIIDFDPGDDTSLAATTYVKHPNQLRRKLKMTEEQLEELDNVTSHILQIIEKNNFKFIDHHQSNQSYSYYIMFIPTDENGDEWPYPAVIQFEVRDHNKKSKNHSGKDIPSNEGWNEDKNRFLKIFKVGDTTCFNTTGVVSEVKKICAQLKQGDYSSLEPMPDFSMNN